MILIFPIGIPLTFASLLPTAPRSCPELEERGLSHRLFRPRDAEPAPEIPEECRKRSAHLKFAEIYEPRCFWFETPIVARLMLMSLLALIADFADCIMTAIVVCLLGIKLYSYYQPFVDDDDDKLAEAAHGSSSACSSLFCSFGKGCRHPN